MEVRIAGQDSEIAILREKAEKRCPRVDTDKEPDQLDREVKVRVDRLIKEKKGKKSSKEVETNYKNGIKAFNEAKESLNKISILHDNLKKALEIRRESWVDFLKSIARRTRQMFNVFLSQKGYAGKVVFDHTKGTLDLEVELDKLRPVNQQVIQDTRSLSGGERSYSTVSLLLALWETMECPFRAMDEFDVFMDAVNRKISIKLLTDAAKHYSHRQFIFITPQDQSAIEGGPNVKIIKMHPPDRGVGRHRGEQSTISTIASSQTDDS